MNDNAPESERWVPVAASDDDRMNPMIHPMPADFFAESAKNSPALDRARREAEAVIAKAFPPKP